MYFGYNFHKIQFIDFQYIKEQVPGYLPFYY